MSDHMLCDRCGNEMIVENEADMVTDTGEEICKDCAYDDSVEDEQDAMDDELDTEHVQEMIEKQKAYAADKASKIGVKPPMNPAPHSTEAVRPTFHQALSELLNSYNMEAVSNTPDFILARYIRNCMIAFDTAVNARSVWYGSAPNNESTESPR